MISLQESHLIHKPSAMMTLLPLDSSLRLNQATWTYLLVRSGDMGRGSRSGALSSAMNLPTSSTSVDEPPRPSTRRTIAPPTPGPAGDAHERHTPAPSVGEARAGGGGGGGGEHVDEIEADGVRLGRERAALL